MKFFYERLRRVSTTLGNYNRVFQKLELPEAVARARRKTANLPINESERIHVCNHGDGTSKNPNKPCEALRLRN